MSSVDARPRVGLIVKEMEGIGGMEMSSFRHMRLLSERIAFVPVSIEESKEDSDWCGRVEQTERFGQTAYRIFASDFRVDRLIGMTDISQLSYVDQIIRIAKQERLTAIHVYGAFAMRPLIGAVAAVRSSLPLMITFRGADLDLRIFGNNLQHLQAALQAASMCVCVNSSSQQVLQRVLRPPCPTSVIHNHVDPADFDADAQSIPAYRQPVIGCVGEFRRIMGLDFLFQAFTELSSRHDLSLLLVGPVRPMEAMYYTNMIDNMEYSERIHRVGSVPHSRVLSYMKACDLLVFPSVADGCPNKVLEAMLAGCAIVATDAGGIPELIRDGVDGILVPPRDSQALGSAIEMLLNDSERRRSLGESARARALSDFTPSREREAWLNCYREAGICL